MATAADAPAEGRTSTTYSGLGTGEAGDQLGFGLVIGLLWRCLGLLRAVRVHVVLLLIGYTLISVVSIPLILTLFDWFWNRAMMGDPITLQAAAGFGLAPEQWVHVDVLANETRQWVAKQAVFWGVLFGLFMAPVSIGLYYYQVWILQRVNQLLRLNLISRLQSLSLRFHADSQIGDAIYRLYQDSAMVTQLVDVLILTPVFAILRFLFLLAILYFFEPVLALIVALAWPPSLLLGGYFSRRLRVGFRAAREANSALTSRIQETLSGIRVIKAYGAEAREQERFADASREAFRQAQAARTRLAFFNVGSFWILGTVLITCFAWAAVMTHRGDPLLIGSATGIAELALWNLGLYGAFKFILGNATNQIRVLFRTWGRTQDIAIGLDRVFELLDLEPEVVEAEHAREMPPVTQDIRFESVAFSYQPDASTLVDVDLTARVGSITAVVGPTGSGKTTLMSLLLRLFDPDRGCIKIDGTDIREYTLDSLRDRTSIALQENVLFATTIRENIRYAAPDASDERVREAARIACADEFIEDLPEGYDTALGERGTKLSSGQRQSLSIARAVLKQTDILILDEPTASLDAVTEMNVLKNLTEWGRERAIFLITHRLSTIRSADQIVYLEAGRMIEHGAHDELMERSGGAYRGLVAADALATNRGAVAS